MKENVAPPKPVNQIDMEEKVSLKKEAEQKPDPVKEPDQNEQKVRVKK